MRFVIQHHMCEDSHYDFMMEDGDALSTWRISLYDFDLLLDGAKIKAGKIQDHRKEYLEYEGDVSGGRGSVKIYDAGECELIFNYDKNCLSLQYKINGRLLKGAIMLQEGAGFYWIQFTGS